MTIQQENLEEYKEELVSICYKIEAEKLKLGQEKKELEISFKEQEKKKEQGEANVRNLQKEIKMQNETNKSLTEAREILVKQLNSSFEHQAKLVDEIMQIKVDGKEVSGGIPVPELLHQIEDSTTIINDLTIENQTLRKQMEEKKN